MMKTCGLGVVNRNHPGIRNQEHSDMVYSIAWRLSPSPAFSWVKRLAGVESHPKLLPGHRPKQIEKSTASQPDMGESCLHPIDPRRAWLRPLKISWSGSRTMDHAWKISWHFNGLKGFWSDSGSHPHPLASGKTRGNILMRTARLRNSGVRRAKRCSWSGLWPFPLSKTAVFGGLYLPIVTPKYHMAVIWLVISYIAFDQIPYKIHFFAVRTDRCRPSNRNIWHPPCQSFHSIWTMWTMRKVQRSPKMSWNISHGDKCKSLCASKTVWYFLFPFYL